MRSRLGHLAMIATLASAAGAAAACDPAAFGSQATRLCARDDAACLPAHLPKELPAIPRGAVLEAVGLAVNDGRARWSALDIDRGELIVVDRYAGRRLDRAPKLARPTAFEYLRREGEGAGRRVDHVRRYLLAPAMRDALACAADAASADRPPVRALTDTAARFWLLLPGKAQNDAATGRFEGEVARFEQLAAEVGSRQRPGLPPR